MSFLRISAKINNTVLLHYYFNAVLTLK